MGTPAYPKASSLAPSCGHSGVRSTFSVLTGDRRAARSCGPQAARPGCTIFPAPAARVFSIRPRLWGRLGSATFGLTAGRPGHKPHWLR